MANIYSVPQNFSTTLNVGGGINNSQTAGIILTSVTGLPTDGGILCFDWASTLDTSVAEFIEYTGISGNELTGVIRGAEGISAKAHSNGAVIAGVISQAHIKRLKERLDGTDTTANVTTMTSPKILTSINDTNGNEEIKFTATASAVNEVTVTNAATNNNPLLSASGGDTNIGLKITGKGTKGVEVTSLDPTVSALTDGVNIATNAALGNYFTVTLAGNRTMDAPTNPTNGQVIIYELKQDATGTRTITWNAAFSFGASGAPTLSTAAAKIDLVSFRYSATATKWLYMGSQLGF